MSDFMKFFLAAVMIIPDLDPPKSSGSFPIQLPIHKTVSMPLWVLIKTATIVHLYFIPITLEGPA